VEELASSAWPLESGPDRRFDVWDRALAMQAHPALPGPRWARIHGFSLPANTQVPAHRRDQVERWIRYTARGVVARERLQEDANGELVSTFTRPWADGTTGITWSPLELLEK
jgi:hypothetical protein